MKRVVVFLLLSGVALAQGGRFDSVAQTTATIGGVPGIVQTVPNASIRVCAFTNLPTVPCASPATTYTDYTLSTPCISSTQVVLSNTNQCVSAADGNGNFGFWLPYGQYIYQVSAAGVAMQTYSLSVGVSGSSSLLVYNLDNIIFVDGVKYVTCQAAVTAAGSAGLVIIPPNFAGTCTYTPVAGVSVWDLRTSAWSISNPGVFTNTQQNLYLQSLIGGCNPTSQWNSVFNLPNHATEASTLCGVIPSGATVFQENSVGAYVGNQNGATTAGVAVFGMATADTTVDGRVWGGNFLATDVAGTKSQSLYSVENDCNILTGNTASICHGLLITGFWKAQPTISMGIEIGPIQQGTGCTTCVWPYGIRFDQGATNAPGTSNAAVYFFPVAAGTSQVSQGMTFLGSSSGGTQDITATENLDIGGNLAIVTSKAGSGIKLNSNPLIQEVSTGTIDLTAQGANIGSATLYAVPASGSNFYRVSCYVVLTTVATTSATLPSCVIGWTDKDNSTVQSLTLTPTNSTNALTNFQENTAPLSVKSSTNITYSTTGYATSGATSMQYAIHIRLEAM